ncbi:hypothetical protein BT96DRAFT_1003784 [Gymnopus androsaceus JB14]|uniref:S1 motif domain-containing protein n=1 Tax=Gymnopus androsaceus JB14 TaxID=1447944 RepID=A0A6A4GUU8_9AGAR|nr:hypothetical protein BT96DRAFT_1003784 [Gymnopus androsaceus JB14]
MLTLAKTTISIDTVKIGQTVGGRVVRHTAHGALVKLPSNIGGILHHTNVSDDFGSAPAFPAVDSILEAAVVSVDKGRKRLTLSTRRSRMYPDKAGTVVDLRGFIKSITDHGLFATVGRNIDARVQIRELFDDFIKDWKPKFKLHQLVQGRILSADANAKKVEMTLRSGNLSKLVALTLSSLSVGKHVEGSVKRIEDYGLFIQIDNLKLSGLCHKSELSDNKEADTAIALRGFRENDRVKAVVVGIKDKRHLSWFGNTVNVDAESSSDSEDSDNEAPSKKRKKQRKEIEQDLTAQMHTNRVQCRFRVVAPWVSQLIIPLDSIHVKISFREEAENLNVWIALLNLESAYGIDKTLEKVFKNAAQANDSKTVHLRLASILDQSGKHKRAEEQSKRTGKKFGLSSKVWTLFAEHYLQRGEIEEPRKLLSRALQSLEKRKQILTGIATVRAYRDKNRSMETFELKYDLEGRAYYVTISLQRWLILRLDLFANVLILGIALFAAGFRNSVNPSKIGDVLSYSLSVAQLFSQIIYQFTQNEQNMNASSVDELSASYPAQGEIEFTDVDMVYREGLPLVLKDVSFHVEPREKNGSWEKHTSSSTLAVRYLFSIRQLLMVRIPEVARYKAGLALVPQDSALFLGTLKQNLDPLGMRTDAELISVLHQACLLRKGQPSNPLPAELRFSLDSEIGDEGSNFCAGEKQLLALCRVLVQKQSDCHSAWTLNRCEDPTDDPIRNLLLPHSYASPIGYTL